MPAHRLLHIDPDKLTIHACRRASLAEEVVFPAGDSGRAEFAAWLARHRKARFRILVDSGFPGFVVDSLPPLGGRDRRQLLARRMERAFPDKRWRLAQRLESQPDGQGEERLLLAALDIAPSAPWIDILQAGGVAVDSLFSPPFLAPAVLRLLDLPTDALLLSIQRGMLRQDFCRGGKLHFSRQAPLRAGSAGDLANPVVREALRLRQYLEGQQLLERQDELPAYLLAPPGTPVELLAGLEAAPFAISIVPAGRGDLPHASGGKGLSPESAFLLALATKASHAHFSCVEDAPARRLAWASTQLRRAGMAALCVGGLLSGSQLAESRVAALETARLAGQAGEMRRLLEERPAPPALPVSEETLRQLARLHGRTTSPENSPTRLYRAISEALDEGPLEIEEIDWQAGDSTLAQSARLRFSGAGAELPAPALAADIRRFAGRLRQTSGLPVSVERPLEDAAQRVTLHLGERPR